MFKKIVPRIVLVASLFALLAGCASEARTPHPERIELMPVPPQDYEQREREYRYQRGDDWEDEEEEIFEGPF